MVLIHRKNLIYFKWKSFFQYLAAYSFILNATLCLFRIECATFFATLVLILFLLSSKTFFTYFNFLLHGQEVTKWEARLPLGRRKKRSSDLGQYLGKSFILTDPKRNQECDSVGYEYASFIQVGKIDVHKVELTQDKITTQLRYICLRIAL